MNVTIPTPKIRAGLWPNASLWLAVALCVTASEALLAQSATTAPETHSVGGGALASGAASEMGSKSSTTVSISDDGTESTTTETIDVDQDSGDGNAAPKKTKRSKTTTIIGRSSGTGGGGGGLIGGGAGGGFITSPSFNFADKKQPDVAFIPIKAMEPQTRTDLAQDIPVMARILEKAVGNANPNGPAAMNVHLKIFGGTGKRHFYLEDYGVVFLLDAQIPLVSRASAEAAKPDKTEADSDWEKTKREMAGANDPAANWVGQEEEEEDFDAQKVEKLKTDVLEALKNAKNLRHLKSTDKIVVSVSSNVGIETIGVPQVTMQANGGTRMVKNQIFMAHNAGPKHSLTISVNKADVDIFARGEINADEFRKRAQILID